MVSANKLQIAGKIKCSTVNGPGCMYTIFFSGCSKSCPGCQNSKFQDFSYGTSEDVLDIFSDIYKNRKFIDGVSLSGGDPFEQQPEPLLMLLKLIDSLDLEVWVWTGYEFLEIPTKYINHLDYIDYLIDGRYVKEQPTTKKYRGSDNQVLWSNFGKCMGWVPILETSEELKEDG